MTEQDIFTQIKPLVSEITGARDDQIHMHSGIMLDLGAESIDLLDFSFLIEETFGVTLEPDEFEQQARARIPGGVYEENGLLTPAALTELKQALPEVPPELLKYGLKKIELPSVLTVAVFVHLIQRKHDKTEVYDAHQ